MITVFCSSLLLVTHHCRENDSCSKPKRPHKRLFTLTKHDNSRIRLTLECSQSIAESGSLNVHLLQSWPPRTIFRRHGLSNDAYNCIVRHWERIPQHTIDHEQNCSGNKTNHTATKNKNKTTRWVNSSETPFHGPYLLFQLLFNTSRLPFVVSLLSSPLLSTSLSPNTTQHANSSRRSAFPHHYHCTCPLHTQKYGVERILSKSLSLYRSCLVRKTCISKISPLLTKIFCILRDCDGMLLYRNTSASRSR